jgi:hypothetical protein
MSQQQRANPLSRMRRIDKESPYFCSIDAWVEFVSVTLRMAIPTKQSAPVAPTSTADDLSPSLDGEVGSIADELRVDPEGASQRAFDLFRTVVGAQLPRRAADQVLKRVAVLETGFA